MTVPPQSFAYDTSLRRVVSIVVERRKCHDNGTGTYAVERMKQMFVGPLNPETGLGLELFTVRLPQFPIEGGVRPS